MTQPHNPRPLVGQRCRIVPSRATGRVIDVAPMSRDLLVELDADRGNPGWYPFANVERLVETETQGHDEHLDAVEAALARPTYDTELAIAGVARGMGRAAFVPKGGA